MIVFNSVLAVNSVKDLIDLATKEPGELKFASAGVGSVGHTAGAMFEAATGTKMTHIPYQGGGTAVVDVVSGHVMLGFLGMPPLMTYEKTGKGKFVALTDGRRSGAMPNLPTLAEQGLPGFSVDNWIGLLARAGTPAPVVARLYAEVSQIMKDPQIDERLKAIGFEPWISDSPVDYKAFLEKDVDKHRQAAQTANITAQ